MSKSRYHTVVASNEFRHMLQCLVVPVFGLGLLLASTASPCLAQSPWFRPTPNHNSGRNNGISGNWFQVDRRYDYENERYRTKVNPNIGNIISDVIKMSQSNPRPVRRPVYSRPAVKPRPVVKPLQNTLPASIVKNTNPFALASNTDLEDALPELDEQIAKKTEELEEQAIDQVEDALGEINDLAFVDPQDRKRFADAVQTGDIDTIRQLGTQYGINQGKIDNLVGAVDSWGTIKEFGDLVSSGASSAEIESAVVEVSNQLQNNHGVTNAQILAMQRTMNDIAVNTTVRDAIISTLASNNHPNNFPTGPCDVYTTPCLREGTGVTAPDGTLILGGDSVGHAEDVPLEDAIGIAVPTGQPLPDVSGTHTTQITSGVLLRNPHNSGGSVNYTVNGHQYTMKQKQQQRLKIGSKWTIVFDRGEEHGEARYTLTAGTYAFKPTEKGWELYKESFSATVSNADNRNEFHYVVHNKSETLQGGEQRQHESNYPLVIAFDQGHGGEPIHKILTKGEYTVGINRENGRLDLFAAQDWKHAKASSASRVPTWKSTSSQPKNQQGRSAWSPLKSRLNNRPTQGETPVNL